MKKPLIYAALRTRFSADKGLIPKPSKSRFYCVTGMQQRSDEAMAVFRVERNKGYTVMSNHHLRNKELSDTEFIRRIGTAEKIGKGGIRDCKRNLQKRQREKETPGLTRPASSPAPRKSRLPRLSGRQRATGKPTPRSRQSPSTLCTNRCRYWCFYPQLDSRRMDCTNTWYR